MSLQPKDPRRTEDDGRPDSWGSILGAIVIGVACLFGLVKMGTCLGGCVPGQLARTTSDAVAISVNQVLPVLVSEWVVEAQSCIDSTTTREAADSCIAGVDRKWLPVWGDYDALKASHDLFRVKVQAGEAPDLLELRAPYCAARKALVPVYQLPDFVQPCAEMSDAGTDAAKDAP